MIRSTSSRGLNLRPCRHSWSRSHSRELAELAGLELSCRWGCSAVTRSQSWPEIDVAERVRGEVADRPDRPVHVLEHAEPVVRRLDAEVLAHALVPHLGQLLELDRPRDQLLLELEAEDDVQVVRRLVGLDANQRRLDPVDRAVPVLELDVAERLRERLAQLRVEEAPERQAAADEVLPHAALRLVQPERRAAGEQRALELAGDPVLVEPVPALVHRPEEAVEVVLEVARRQPDVGRRPSTSRRDGRPCRAATRCGRTRSARPPSARTPSAGRSGTAAPRAGRSSVAANRRDERHLRLLQPRRTPPAPRPSSCPARSRRAARRTARRSRRRSTRCSAAAARGSLRSREEDARSRTSWRASAHSGSASEFERGNLGGAGRRERGAPSPTRAARSGSGSPRPSRRAATPRRARAPRAAGRSRPRRARRERARPSVPSCSARTSPPRGGMFTC